MDDVTRAIAEFAVGAYYAQLDDDVRQAAAIRLFDAVGCALGASASSTVRAVSAAVAPPGLSAGTGRTIGAASAQTPADAAAFVNTTLIRYLDFNDWVPNLHPSDCLGGLLAFANEPDVDGTRLLAAIVVAYEVAIGLTDAMGMRRRGFDQGYAIGIATAAGLGTLLRLNRETIAHAVAIMASSGLATGATRSGELSVWKGCATAFATRNAAFAIQLARAGVTGPDRPFAGERGLFEVVTGRWQPVFEPGAPRIRNTVIKAWPACFHGQAPIAAALRLRDQVSAEDIASIEIRTYGEAVVSTGSDASRWDPLTRETADHSIPYLVARALVDGRIDEASFTEHAVRDPALRPLMRRISVSRSVDADRRYPQDIVAVARARTNGGDDLTVTVAGPPGHRSDPRPAGHLRAKFLDLAQRSDAARASGLDAVADAWWDVSGRNGLAHALALIGAA